MRDVTFGSGEKIIDAEHLMTGVEQQSAKMRTDETRPSGYQNTAAGAHRCRCKRNRSMRSDGHGQPFLGFVRLANGDAPDDRVGRGWSRKMRGLRQSKPEPAAFGGLCYQPCRIPPVEPDFEKRTPNPP